MSLCGGDVAIDADCPNATTEFLKPIGPVCHEVDTDTDVYCVASQGVIPKTRLPWPSFTGGPFS